MKKLIISGILVSALVLISSAAAETTSTGGIKGQIKDLRQGIQNQVNQAREALKTSVSSTRAELEAVRQNTKQITKEAFEQYQEKRQQAVETLKQQKEDSRKKIEAQRQELQIRVQSQKQELEQKLTAIKDAKKKDAVAKLNNQFGLINTERVNHFSNVVNQLEDVLGRITSRTDKAEANSLDVSAVRTAITAAKNMIAAARTAIETQSGKTYPFVITTEANLKTDVGKTRQALQADLKKTEEAVKAARQSVKDAAGVLSKIPGINNLKVENPVATSTASTSTNQ